MGTTPRPAPWRTSSFSSNGSDCVQIRHDLTAVRDSKNPHGPVLRVDVRGLAAGIRSGQAGA